MTICLSDNRFRGEDSYVFNPHVMIRLDLDSAFQKKEA